MNWTNWTKGGGWLVVMLALSWCGGCGGKGEDQLIQDYHAAAMTLDREAELRDELEKYVIDHPDDQEMKVKLSKQIDRVKRAKTVFEEIDNKMNLKAPGR